MDSHFKLGSLSSVTVTHWKRRVENALHLLALINAAACKVQALIKCCTVFCFLFLCEISLSQNFLKFRDIILRHY